MGVETGRHLILMGLEVTGDTSYSPQQRMLGDQLSAVFDQPARDRKCLRSEGDDLVPALEPLAGEIQAKVTEREASIPLPSSHPVRATF